ncbi:MAG: histidinol-phosphatase [Prosthecochloris sp.]|uniref:histidinol-phosphatase n=1 Tax=Prosthecochloris sp. ZM_2 TaxID=2045206 RepID=UPI000DF7BA02|nr:histidinol-phosphatase [Prosthecochloris sp. ZM_2]MEC9486804.1 histidinol-phosphatase [Prosthecochloris sp.]RNA64642.1 histidinol-phosphatase [Prosthecochloris sp. ZM_2]
MTEDLAFAVELARRAGELTMNYFGKKSLKIDEKRDDTPVTEADRRAEQLIREGIGARFPQDGIFGEEFEEKISGNARRWILDPIDGTRSFIHGVPLFGVMIALEVEHSMRAGVVHFPALGQTCYAEQGGGAFLNDGAMSVSGITDLRDSTVTFTEKEYLLDPPSDHPVDRLRHEAGLVRGWGDCYGHMLVASGRAEVAVDKEMSPWDCAAVIPIVTEAGGRCFDYKGRTTIYGEGLVSANRSIGDTLLGEIPA